MTKRLQNHLPAVGECATCGEDIGSDWREGHECPHCGSEQGVGWL